jgi:hypothetical protein
MSGSSPSTDENPNLFSRESHMKKYILIILSILAILAASACSATSQGTAALGVSTSGEASQAGGGSGLTIMQLALGTFKLDQTDYSIGAQEAGELLPLWKAYRSLSQSDTTAAEEIQALVSQIQSTMTPEQVKAIEAMNLSIQDLQSISQELGLNLGTGSGPGNLSPQAQATMQASGNSGQAPAGGFGGGPEGIPGAGGLPGVGVQAMQTAMPSGVSSGTGLGVDETLLGAVVDFLAAKTQ